MAKDLDSLPKLNIRGQIAPKNSVFSLFGEEETVSASDVANWLDEHKDDPEIAVVVSSDGGYKTEGVEIRSLLKNSGKIVHTIGYRVNSIATVVFLSNTEGGKRYVVEDPMDFVIHFARIDPMNLGTDALTAEDFARLAAEVSRSDKQILDVYCEELGEDRRTELLAAMAEERNLGARGAIKLGFANGYYKKKKKEKPTKVEDFKGLLIEDEIASIIINNMEKDKEKEMQTKLTGMESVVNGLKKLVHKMFNGEIKNEITVTTDKGPLHLVPADAATPDNLVGARAYQVDADGIPLLESPADDGEYTAEGKVYVIKDGAVTEINEAVDAKKLTEDLEAEKQKTATLEAEIAELKQKMETQKTEFNSTVATIQNEFASFKKMVPKDKKEKDDTDDDKPPVDISKMTASQRLHYMRKEQGYGRKQ